MKEEREEDSRPSTALEDLVPIGLEFLRSRSAQLILALEDHL